MKGLAQAALVSALVTLGATSAFATTPLPPPAGYVNDLANVLSAETETSLEAELSAFEQSNSNEIAVVTINSMAGDYIEHYAEQLFQQWGIGKKDKDNGVLLLLSIEERKIRIEVGYGLEGALPDSVADSIIRNDLTPRLKAGDYDGAVTAAVHDIEAATKGEYEGEGDSGEAPAFDWWLVILVMVVMFQWLVSILARSKSWWAGGVLGGAVGAVIAVVVGFMWVGLIAIAVLGGLGLLLDYLVSRAYHSSVSRGVHTPWWAGGGGFGGGSSGGFGGFGGGSSGGGGASGSW